VLLRVHVGIDGDAGRVPQQATNDPALRMLATVAIEVFESTVWKLECHRRRIAARLTSAQRRVLEYMVQGHSERKIGELLERSPHTVHDHIRAIYHTLEIASRSDLLLLWNAPDAAPRAIETPVGADA
jgi:DNA-binding NarL/FixJ family response regulator